MGASAFLERFRRAGNSGSPLAAIIDDHEGLGTALATMPDALGDAFDEAVQANHGPPVAINADCFASAACDRNGILVAEGPCFADWFAGIDPFGAALRDIGPGHPRVSLFADDRSGRPVALAAGTEAAARLWPLDPAVRAALSAGHATYAVVAFRPGESSWEQSAAAFRLTAAEAGLVAALGRHGDLQRAAAERGIAYETARKFVASALRKTGTKRQTDLVRRTLAAAAGDIAQSHGLVRLTRDLFGLSERQARLAILIAGGATRESAASAIGMSDQRAKTDLKAVFQACGVTSAVDLARIVAEIDALEGLATACEVTIVGRGHSHEPLRLVPRRWSAGQIAVADHGPVGATPVLVLHSNVSGRHHPARFIAALQAAGFRPIAVERAGYGLTDDFAGGVIGNVAGDRIEAAVADMHDVLDALGLETALCIARCNTASVVACAAEAHGRITGGVLLWPEGPRRVGRPETRMVDPIRAIFSRYPALAHRFARMASRRAGSASFEKMWRKASHGIPADLALLDDPDECADVMRGAQQAALGMTGFVEEALALGNGPAPRRIADARAWSVMFGSQYGRISPSDSADASEAIAWWALHMPGARIHMVDGGLHFLHSTHTAEVIDALRHAMADQNEFCVAA